jgi:hypothetical protein
LRLAYSGFPGKQREFSASKAVLPQPFNVLGLYLIQPREFQNIFDYGFVFVLKV